MVDQPSSSRPPVPVTAEFLAECRRKQAAYEESRRRYRAAFERPTEDEAEEPVAPVPAGSTAGTPRRRSRGKTHDPRQLRFEV